MRNRSFIALLAILVVLPSFAEIAGAQPDHDAAALGAKLTHVN